MDWWISCTRTRSQEVSRIRGAIQALFCDESDFCMIRRNWAVTFLISLQSSASALSASTSLLLLKQSCCEANLCRGDPRTCPWPRHFRTQCLGTMNNSHEVSRVGEERKPPPPSSNRTGRFPASGLPNNCHREADAGGVDDLKNRKPWRCR